MALMQWANVEGKMTCRVVCPECWYQQPKIAFPRNLPGGERDRLWSAAYAQLQVVNGSESIECPTCKQMMHRGARMVDHAEELLDPQNNVELTCDRYVLSPSIGGIYQHRKGTLYKVKAIAEFNANPIGYQQTYTVVHSENLEAVKIFECADGRVQYSKMCNDSTKPLVIYHDLAGTKFWARPLEMFCDGRFSEVEVYAD